jgi:Ca2+-binding EF-hand superfamily protein
VKLLILFYDQDHDFALTFGEIFKIIHPGKEFPNLPEYIRSQELNPRVDTKLYNLLEQEVLMARNVLALLDELKNKRDFNIHSAFHALKYYACITGDSVNLFLKNCGMEPTTGDIRAIIKRLDINKDEIVDFCEFHAFLGYPDCSFCCPCFPCPNCGIKYCEECLNDIPCYLLGCDHKSMNSKMRCTSIEHNPNIDKFNSLMNSKNMNLNSSKFNWNNSLYKSKLRMNEEEENEKNKNDFKNKNKYPFMKNNNGLPGNISPEQYNLLQGLTNPEQLNKFMKINDILDRQNSEPIKITNNLSLRLSPLRDFDPKDWGCKNCPCNIYGNPNVPCNCCTCNICPNRKIQDANKAPIKQRKFPKINLYSYTYTYEPDINNETNSDIFNPKMNISNRNKDSPYTNKNGKTMANSSDEEKDYNLTKNKNRYNNGFQNGIIYSDDAMNMNKNYRFNNNRSINNDEQENINDINNNNINDINEKQQLNKIYRYDENNNKNNNEDNEEKNINENGEENKNQTEPNDNININNNLDNNYNTYSPNNDNNQENPFNRNNNNQNSNIPDNVMYKTSPESFNIGNNKKNSLYDSLGFKLTKTVNLNLNQNSQINSQVPKEEENEDDFYSSRRNIYNKSQKEIIDDEELKFLKYLKALIKSEREIEFARRDLMRQKDFNGEDAFRLFEVAGTGVVTMVDLIFGLKLLGVKCTQNQIKLIFNVYDLEGNGVLNYSDFFDMVIAYKDEDRKEEERRKANRNVGNRNINIFSPKTRELYKKLFLVIIEEEERLEELKLKLEINDDLIKGVFNRINIDGDWICDKYEFVNYCLRNKVCKEKKDAYLAFIRLNRKRDGGLDIKDISVGLKSSVLGK